MNVSPLVHMPFRRAEIKAEQNVLVIGAGPIGLATAAIAVAKEAHVVVADIDCQRRQHVVDHLAINAFNPTQEDFIAALREAFEANWLASYLMRREIKLQ